MTSTGPIEQRFIEKRFMYGISMTEQYIYTLSKETASIIFCDRGENKGIAYSINNNTEKDSNLMSADIQMQYDIFNNGLVDNISKNRVVDISISYDQYNSILNIKYITVYNEIKYEVIRQYECDLPFGILFDLTKLLSPSTYYLCEKVKMLANNTKKCIEASVKNMNYNIMLSLKIKKILIVKKGDEFLLFIDNDAVKLNKNQLVLINNVLSILNEDNKEIIVSYLDQLETFLTVDLNEENFIEIQNSMDDSMESDKLICSLKSCKSNVDESKIIRDYQKVIKDNYQSGISSNNSLAKEEEYLNSKLNNANNIFFDSMTKDNHSTFEEKIPQHYLGDLSIIPSNVHEEADKNEIVVGHDKSSNGDDSILHIVNNENSLVYKSKIIEDLEKDDNKDSSTDKNTIYKNKMKDTVRNLLLISLVVFVTFLFILHFIKKDNEIDY